MDWGYADVGGVEKREASCEGVDGVGCGERFIVGSWGDLGFRGLEMDIWRLRFGGRAREVGSVGICP